MPTPPSPQIAITFPLRAKLLLVFLVMSALVAVLCGVAVRDLNEATAGGTVDAQLAQLDDLSNLQRSAHSLRLYTAAIQPEQAATRAARLKQLEPIETETAVVRAASNDSLGTGIDGARTELLAATDSLSDLADQTAKPADITAARSRLVQAAAGLEATAKAAATQTQAGIKRHEDFSVVQASQAQRTLGWLAGAIIGVILLLGFLMAGFVVRRLRQFTEVANHVAAGDFSKTVSLDSRDEIGQLAQTFNQMVGRLDQSYERLSQEKLRSDILLDSIGDGLMAIDDQGRVMLANKVACRMLELGEESMIVGKKVYDAFKLVDATGKTVTRRQQPAMETLKSGQLTIGLFDFVKRDKRKLAVSVMSNPVVTDGKTSGAILIIRNVTKEREVDRMKTEFISLASHQLRTPLSAIRWFSEMLVGGDAGKLKPEQLEFARNISESTLRMIQLVNALLNISRIESGRMIIEPELVNLRELVSGIIKDLQAKTAERDQHVSIKIDSDLPRINLDPRLIGQVYLNLLTNAMKYTPAGGEISVTITRKDDQVVSQITDNGYGIPRTQQGKLFQKFFRADNVVKTETDGTGLGLYLVKNILDMSSGKIWFQSTEGKGTTFWFTLPIDGMKAKAGEVKLDV